MILDTLIEHPAYGQKRLSLELKINIKRIKRVIKIYGIKTYRRKKQFIKLDDLGNPASIYQNLIKNSCAFKPNTIFVGDFTYLRVNGKFLYLATFLDQFTREIVGFSISSKHNKMLVIEALLDAIKNVGKPQIIHTDQGSEYKGFNPNAKYHKNDSNFYTIGKEIEGWRILAAENFNQKEIWSVLQSYLNGTVNEMYTTYRVSPENNNRVYPTVVVRQKPFSSEHYVSPQVTTPVKPEPKPYTKFLSLPRWKISSDLMFMVDLGKDEAARVNFVQVFGRSLAASDAENRSMQVGKGNFFYDGKDVQRHGLKPIIASSVFDYPGGISETQSRNWAYLLFDMLNAGQLKESGAISSVGIVHPISVGDNLEFDDCVYHIEQVTHNMKEDPDGKLSFRTNLILSFGTNLNSTKDLPIYPQMQHTDSYRERLKDNANEGILPGVSDTQDIAGRVQGEEVQETKEQSFTGGSVDKKGMERASSLSYNVKKDKLSKDE